MYFIKDPLIFVVTHDTDRGDNTFATKKDRNIVEISFSSFSDLLDIHRKNLRKFILDHFFKYIGDYKSYEKDIAARLNSL